MKKAYKVLLQKKMEFSVIENYYKMETMVNKPLSLLVKKINNLENKAILFILIIVVIALILTYFIIARNLRPLGYVNHVLELIAEGEYEAAS